MKHTYKNLIFDVGGVLLDYRWEWAIADAGITIEEAKRISLNMFQDPLWGEFDLGIRPYDEVVDDYCRKYPEDEGAIRFFLTHLNNMPLPRPRVWNEVHRLKEAGYRIYLLSNYSETMFRAHTDGLPFWPDVDGALVSYMVHLIKPDHAIYEELLRRFSLDAAESLFFDDRKENTDAAIACGLDAVTVQGEEHLLSELQML